MHPGRTFAWEDRGEMLAFIADRAFCTIFATSRDPAVFHVPVIVAGPETLRFHVSRANRGAASLADGRVLLSCAGPDSYVSPDWYGTPDQVPTWNYVAVEIEGPVRLLEEAELSGLLDALSAAHKSRLAPKPAWTRAKMSPGRFEGLVKAIIGYEISIEALRGTRKLGQNKKANEHAGAIAGLEGAGRTDMAGLMRATNSSLSRSDGEGAHAQHGGGVTAEASTLPLPHPPSANGPPPPASRGEE